MSPLSAAKLFMPETAESAKIRNDRVGNRYTAYLRRLILHCYGAEAVETQSLAQGPEELMLSNSVFDDCY
jgi:hypothetical protein